MRNRLIPFVGAARRAPHGPQRLCFAEPSGGATRHRISHEEDVASPGIQELGNAGPGEEQRPRDTAPRLLSAQEAVELALFRSYFCKGLLHIPEVKEVLLSDLTWAEAKAFIRQVEAPE